MNHLSCWLLHPLLWTRYDKCNDEWVNLSTQAVKLFRVMLCWSVIARDWLQTTVGLQKRDICQTTSNNILPAWVFWESKQTRGAALLSVIYTVNSRTVLPSSARMPRWRFHLLTRMPLGDCLFGLPPLGGYRVRYLGFIYGICCWMTPWTPATSLLIHNTAQENTNFVFKFYSHIVTRTADNFQVNIW